MKPRLNVLVLFDLPAPPTREDYADQLCPEDWKNEQDVIDALKKLGHQVRVLGIHNRIHPLLVELRRHPPDIVFNLVETFANDRRHESSVVGLLDLLDVPYTGSKPTALAVCRNKSFTKRILAPHRIKVPRSQVFPLGQKTRSLRQLHFPVIVKPLNQEGSDGIAQSSFVENAAACWERIAFLHDSLKTDAMAEEYIEGRELYACLLGNQRLRVLPLREMVFTQFPEERPKFATFKAKWDPAFRERWGIDNRFADAVPDSVERKISRISRLAFRTLLLSGYARLDLRLTSNHDIYVIEVNPNPSLERSDELAQAASRDKLPYHHLIQRILELGLEAKGKQP